MKDLVSTLLTSQEIIDLYQKRIEKEDNPEKKKVLMRELKHVLSNHSRVIDSLMIQLNLDKADVSEVERELSLILNKEQDGN